jgi:hypothetical protein
LAITTMGRPLTGKPARGHAIQRKIITAITNISIARKRVCEQAVGLILDALIASHDGSATEATSKRVLNARMNALQRLFGKYEMMVATYIRDYLSKHQNRHAHCTVTDALRLWQLKAAQCLGRTPIDQATWRRFVKEIEQASDGTSPAGDLDRSPQDVRVQWSEEAHPPKRGEGSDPTCAADRQN